MSVATTGLRVGARVGVMLMAAGAWTAAHEGHGTAAVKPVYREVQAGDTRVRLGFAMQPQDALVGEDIRLEFHILLVSSPASGATAMPGQLEVQVIPAGGAPMTPHVSPGEKPGTFLVRHRFDTAGQYRVATRLVAGAETAGTEFPILVSSGPVLKTAMVVDAIVILIVGALLFGRMRRSQPTASAGWGGSAALAGVGVAALVVGHMWLSPSIGRTFLPERHTGSVPWEAPPQATGAAAVGEHEHPPGTPPHTHDAEPAKAPETPPHSHPPGTPPHSHGKESPPPSGQRP